MKKRNLNIYLFTIFISSHISISKKCINIRSLLISVSNSIQKCPYFSNFLSFLHRLILFLIDLIVPWVERLWAKVSRDHKNVQERRFRPFNFRRRACDPSINRWHAQNGNRLASFEWGMSAETQAPLEFASHSRRIVPIYWMPRVRPSKDSQPF